MFSVVKYSSKYIAFLNGRIFLCHSFADLNLRVLDDYFSFLFFYFILRRFGLVF